MKKILFSLCLVAIGVAYDSTAYAQSEIASCATVEALPSKNFLYKNSAPLRQGGPGTPLVGFRRQPTLIMNKSYTRQSTKIYDSQDNLLGTCPWASAHGHAGGRFRCTLSTGKVRRQAVKNTGSPVIYFIVKASTKFCAKVPDAGKCYGSNKGLCNTTIK